MDIMTIHPNHDLLLKLQTKKYALINWQIYHFLLFSSELVPAFSQYHCDLCKLWMGNYWYSQFAFLPRDFGVTDVFSFIQDNRHTLLYPRQQAHSVTQDNRHTLHYPRQQTHYFLPEANLTRPICKVWVGLKYLSSLLSSSAVLQEDSKGAGVTDMSQRADVVCG